jgi:inhibitor of cysteine peptidase
MRFKKSAFQTGVFGSLLCIISACNGNYQPARELHDDADTTISGADSFTNAAADTVAIGMAQIDEVLVQQNESMPVQVRVVVRGNLPDGCTKLDTSSVALEENTFKVLLPTRRPKRAMCTQALVPYEKIIPLNVEELSSGQFTVSVNGSAKTFNLLKKDQLDK